MRQKIAELLASGHSYPYMLMMIMAYYPRFSAHKVASAIRLVRTDIRLGC